MATHGLRENCRVWWGTQTRVNLTVEWHADRSRVPEGAAHEFTWGNHPNALTTVAGEVLQVAGHKKFSLCRQCHFEEWFVIGVRKPGLERLACGNLAPGTNLRQERCDFRCLERNAGRRSTSSYSAIIRMS